MSFHFLELIVVSRLKKVFAIRFLPANAHTFIIVLLRVPNPEYVLLVHTRTILRNVPGTLHVKGIKKNKRGYRSNESNLTNNFVY